MQWQQLAIQLEELAKKLSADISEPALDAIENNEVEANLPLRGDCDNLECFCDELEQCTDDLLVLLDQFTRQRCDAVALIEFAEDAIENLEDAAEEIEWTNTEASKLFSTFLISLGSISKIIDHDIRGRRDFYVYIHKNIKGDIFYVGKGTGKRAWSEDRHEVWRRYVEERLGGKYEVDIAKKNLLESEAEELEDELINRHGDSLVNWVNPGRQFDYAALERFHTLRDANRQHIDETKKLENVDPERAVTRYRVALDRMKEYESLVLERGLVAELMAGPKSGDPAILDRLTLCLAKLGRVTDMVAEADRYFAEFPAARDLGIGQRILKRVGRLKKNNSQTNDIR